MKIPLINMEVRRKQTDYENETIVNRRSAVYRPRMNYGNNESNTQFKRQIIDTIAREFSKQKFRAMNIKTLKRNDELEYIINTSANRQQSAYEWKNTMITQLYTYGNAIAIPIYDEKDLSQLNEIVVKDLSCYQFGYGYSEKFEKIFLLIKNLKNNQIQMLPYEDIIHMRLTPNDIFNLDINYNLDPTKAYSNVFDKTIDAYLESMTDNGRVTAIVRIGGNQAGLKSKTSASKDQKDALKNDLEARISEAFDSGLLVLDDTETFEVLNKQWNKTTTEEMQVILDTMYSLYGINKSVIDGSASAEQMQAFIMKTIKPLCIQLEQELNRKLLSEAAIRSGQRILNIINPFEYSPITDMGDTIYKISHVYSKNEIREFMGSGPTANGDVVHDNLNFTSRKVNLKKNDIIG